MQVTREDMRACDVSENIVRDREIIQVTSPTCQVKNGDKEEDNFS